jgi:hypothetical protein
MSPAVNEKLNQSLETTKEKKKKKEASPTLSLSLSHVVYM